MQKRMLNWIAAGLVGLGAASAGNYALADGGTVRAVIGDDLGSVDPVWTTADTTRLASLMIYDTLFGWDADLVSQPQMVDTWSVTDDGLDYTFTLRDGLAFHDGTPVTSTDVIASWKRWAMMDARGQMIATFMDRFEEVDDKTWKVMLKEPFGQLISAIGSPFSMPLFIMPERLASTPADQELTEAMGSGPFRFAAEERVPGSISVFVKNEAYVPRAEPLSGMAGDKSAHVDRVEWLSINDEQTAASALQAGEVDILYVPSADLLPGLLAQDDIRSFETDKSGIQGIMRLNHLNPPFDKPEIRHALQNFVHQKDTILAVTGNPDGGQVCGAILICGSPWGSEIGAEDLISDAPNEERNAKGMAALEAAGYAGEPITILYPQEARIQGNATLVIAEAMRQAGVNVNLVPTDWATVRQRRTVKESGPNGWHIFLTYGGGISSSDMAFHIPASAGCDDAWFGWPCDAEIERLRRAWVTEADPEKARQIAEDYQKRAMEVTVYLPYGQFDSIMAVREEVQDIPSVPETLVFWGMTKTE